MKTEGAALKTLGRVPLEVFSKDVGDIP